MIFESETEEMEAAGWKGAPKGSAVTRAERKLRKQLEEERRRAQELGVGHAAKVIAKQLTHNPRVKVGDGVAGDSVDVQRDAARILAAAEGEGALQVASLAKQVFKT